MIPYDTLRRALKKALGEIQQSGLYKSESIITSSQGTNITLQGSKSVLNFCANNYLGLANDERIVKAAERALRTRGFGLSSVRFICGTQDIHKNLENQLTEFLGTEDTILYASAFDANAGLFETLLGEEDAIISDTLNHASVIDGIRLCKAQRLRYRSSDMQDLEQQLQEASSARYRLIATDGVFSMDGTIAALPEICALAKKYHALVMIDDCHGTGVLGAQGRGTHEYHKVIGQIDIITGTLGKALGGASGGFTSGRKEIIDLLRQRSRPYLFSNSVPPMVVGASLEALQIIKNTPTLQQKLRDNVQYFRNGLQKAGFTVLPSPHPIIPIMLFDSVLAKKLAEALLTRDVYVVGFSYPVVPKGKARVRVQISSAHTIEELDHALLAFEKEGTALGVI